MQVSLATSYERAPTHTSFIEHHINIRTALVSDNESYVLSLRSLYVTRQSDRVQYNSRFLDIAQRVLLNYAFFCLELTLSKQTIGGI